MIVAPEIHTEVLTPKMLVSGGVRKAASGRSAHGFRLPPSRPRAPPAVSRPAPAVSSERQEQTRKSPCTSWSSQVPVGGVCRRHEVCQMRLREVNVSPEHTQLAGLGEL